MALSVALPLSGLENESFSTFDLFGLKNILSTVPQGSPTPSSSSDSSGLGSLGSLPPSPHDGDKPSFAEKKTPAVPEVRIMYGGRDILDLGRNADPEGWKFQHAFLPKNNTSFFFANRSQYHRLGGYPEADEFVTETCPQCGFTYIVQ